MLTLWYTVGLPGSGKSTWAKERVASNPGQYKRVNKDDLRAMMDASHWSKGNEKFVVNVRDSIIYYALREGKHVIVDDTNFHPSHIEAFEEIVNNLKAEGINVQVKKKDFTHVTVEECIERDLKRPNSVGEKVIRRMYNDFLRPPEEKQMEQRQVNLIPRDPDLPDAILVDLDGTLAHNPNRRGWYEWNRVGEDDLVDAIYKAVTAFSKQGYHILVMSGRDGVCEPETREWLARHNVPYAHLFMRTKDDGRKDAIIKRELFEKHIRGRFNVLFSLDDRNQVVDMWREIGIPCFQVAPGDF